MIRVLQFADIINRYDFIDTLVQYADPHEFEMSVCVRSKEHNIAPPVFSAATKYKLLSGNSRRDIVPTAWKLARILKEWNIDVIHAHHYYQGVIAWLATSIHPRTKFIFGRHYSDLIQNLPGLKRSFYLALEQKVNHAADRIIVPSTFIYDILTKQQKVDGAKIDVVAYGFAAEKYSSLTADKIEDVRRELDLNNRFVTASFGKLTEGKGVRFLIEAIVKLKDKIPNLLVLFVGEGDERGFLEKTIAVNELENTVKILGWRTDAMTIMANADVVVQPTLSEAFSQVMGEAMWLAKPLIITDVSGATDIIENGENGIIVPKGDAGEIALAIETLYENQILRRTIAKQGRIYVEENLLINKKIKEYEKTFIKAVHSN
jgi:glycosyltransferase EpsD